MSLQSLSTQKDIKLFHDDIVSPQIIKAAQSHLSYSYYVESGLVTSNVTCTFVCFNKKLATTLNKNVLFLFNPIIVIIRIYKKQSSQCLKIIQIVSFIKFWHFPHIFVILKLTCLVTLFYRKKVI